MRVVLLSRGWPWQIQAINRIHREVVLTAVYLEGGIRSCEIGSVMFGKHAPPPMELVRLAFPRRVYTQSHFDYVIEVILEVFKNTEKLRGMELTYEAPTLRHFTARFAYL